MVGSGPGFASSVRYVVVRLGGGIRGISLNDVPGSIEVDAAEAFEEHGGHDLRREIREWQSWRHAGDGGKEGCLHFVHGVVEIFPDFIHQEDHALLRGEKVLVRDEVVFVSHAGHVHEEDKVQVRQGFFVVFDTQVEIRDSVVHVAELRPFAGHDVEGNFLLEGAVKDVPGGIWFTALGEGILRFADFPFGQAVILTDVQDVGHVMPDFRLAFLGEDVNLRHAVGIVGLGNLGNDAPGELGMRAFAGETVTLQEIRECFVRQHADRLLRPAVADPAILIQKPDPVIGVLAVNLQLVRRYLMMHRLAVEVVEYQNVPDR